MWIRREAAAAGGGLTGGGALAGSCGMAVCEFYRMPAAARALKRTSNGRTRRASLTIPAFHQVHPVKLSLQALRHRNFSLFLSGQACALIGFGILIASVSVNMILQTIVDDDKRGRVMSFYTAAFLGMAPFGSLAAGALADVIGVANTLFLGGAACAACALFIAGRRRQIREHIRPIYARLGIPASH